MKKTLIISLVLCAFTTTIFAQTSEINKKKEEVKTEPQNPKEIVVNNAKYRLIEE